MIAVNNLTIRYPGKTVFENKTLVLPQGVKVALTGPSGCGKTTFMHALCGLTEPAAGSITCDTAPAVVFQEPRLVPHLTVLENVLLVLPPEKSANAEKYLDLLELSDGKNAYPRELSGGMLQRAAIARALSYNGGLLLLDEPFKALDAELKMRVMTVVKEAAAESTLLLITHDHAEAEFFGCKILDFAAL